MPPDTLEYLERCLSNLKAAHQPMIDKIEEKKRSNQTLTAEEDDFQDGEGNMCDEELFVDVVSMAADKEAYIASIKSGKFYVSLQRLISYADVEPPPPTTTKPLSNLDIIRNSRKQLKIRSANPASIVSTAPALDSASYSLSTLTALSDQPVVPTPTVSPASVKGIPSSQTRADNPPKDPSTLPPSNPHADTNNLGLDSYGSSPSAAGPTEVYRLKRLPQATPFRLGDPYAFVGPVHTSISKLPELMTKLIITRDISEYMVHFLSLGGLDDCECCFALGQYCSFLTHTITVDDPDKPTRLYVGPCRSCACAHRLCNTEGEYTWSEQDKTVPEQKRPRSESPLAGKGKRRKI